MTSQTIFWDEFHGELKGLSGSKQVTLNQPFNSSWEQDIDKGFSTGSVNILLFKIIVTLSSCQWNRYGQIRFFLVDFYQVLHYACLYQTLVSIELISLTSKICI